MTRHGARALVASATLTLAACGRGGLDPAGNRADRILDVTVVLTVAAVVVIGIVLGAWAWALARRGSEDTSGASPEDLAGRTERWWVVGGGVVLPGVVMALLFGLGVWTMGLQPDEPEVVVEVVGHQYWWEVTYHDAPGMPEGATVTTANQLHVPTDAEVRVDLASEDVIHSFWVPELAGKVDLVPGRDTRLSFTASQPGTYAGYCAEFCGLQHAWMKFEVVASPADEFGAWIDRTAQPAREPATAAQRRGREVFTSNSCVGCHAIRGVAEQGDAGPDLTHLASRDEIGAGILPLDRDNLAAWVANAQAIKRGAKMPPQTLTEQELDDLVAYLQHLE